jgi:hypothetical protein
MGTTAGALVPLAVASGDLARFCVAQFARPVRAELVASCRVVVRLTISRTNFEAPLAIALEINLALWIMIACAAIRASELISF